MGREKRVHYPGLVFHVVNRGNNQQAVFLEPDDQKHYLGCLYHYKKKYGFDLFAFCLMTNHVHLLIRVADKSISKIMQSVAVGYSRWYNHKYRSSGHVWQGRFKASVVGDHEYFLTAMQYIEENPVRAGIVNDVGSYLFSSYKLNVRGDDSKLIDRDKNEAFQALGSSDIERCSAYRQRMALRLQENSLKEVRISLTGNGGYMSSKFREQMKLLLPTKRKRGRPRKAIIA